MKNVTPSLDVPVVRFAADLTAPVENKPTAEVEAIIAQSRNIGRFVWTTNVVAQDSLPLAEAVAPQALVSHPGLYIRYLGNTGYGTFTDQPIAIDTPVCRYDGELTLPELLPDNEGYSFICEDSGYVISAREFGGYGGIMQDLPRPNPYQHYPKEVACENMRAIDSGETVTLIAKENLNQTILGFDYGSQYVQSQNQKRYFQTDGKVLPAQLDYCFTPEIYFKIMLNALRVVRETPKTRAYIQCLLQSHVELAPVQISYGQIWDEILRDYPKPAAFLIPQLMKLPISILKSFDQRDRDILTQALKLIKTEDVSASSKAELASDPIYQKSSFFQYVELFPLAIRAAGDTSEDICRLQIPAKAWESKNKIRHYRYIPYANFRACEASYSDAAGLTDIGKKYLDDQKYQNALTYGHEALRLFRRCATYLCIRGNIDRDQVEVANQFFHVDPSYLEPLLLLSKAYQYLNDSKRQDYCLMLLAKFNQVLACSQVDLTPAFSQLTLNP